MTLDRVQPSHTCVITAVNGSGALRRRLLDLGLTPKTIVEIIKTAPMGDPLEIRLRGYSLTIRKAEAENIDVKEVQKI